MNRKFIPKVHKAIADEKEELHQAKNELANFLIGHNKLAEKDKYYKNEPIRLKEKFQETYKTEYVEFMRIFNNSLDQLAKHNHKVKLHTENIQILNEYIEKYNNFME